MDKLYQTRSQECGPSPQGNLMSNRVRIDSLFLHNLFITLVFSPNTSIYSRGTNGCSYTFTVHFLLTCQSGLHLPYTFKVHSHYYFNVFFFPPHYPYYRLLSDSTSFIAISLYHILWFFF